MKRLPLLLIVPLCLLLLTCAENRSGPFAVNFAGPTLTTRAADGYALANRHARFAIDAVSGDVCFAGQDGGKNELLAAVRYFAAVGGEPRLSACDGYVEFRDDQTWQYFGEDAANGLGWRKIYCLDGDRLNVSCLVTNRQTNPVRVKLFLQTANFRIAGQPVTLQTFNETNHDATPPPYALASDWQDLQPGQRMSWTMSWWWKPAGGGEASGGK